MQAANRITINTIAQYTKTIISIILGLYSTRLILQGLGESDYGIYTLLAGIVGMMTFLVNALALTTQRYLSYNQGKGNLKFLELLFFNSLFVHIVIGIACLVILEITGLFLIERWLTIPAERIHAAYTVFHCAIVMLVLSIISSPFRALLISHENLIFTSIVDILDAGLKVVIALIVLDSDCDHLVLFAVLMCSINLFSLLAYSIYDKLKYREFKILGLKNIKWSIIKPMAQFAGWSLYSNLCIIGRNQGVAILMNRICGTLANAAYGIAVQVSAAVNYLISSLLNAVSPPLIKAEGAGNRELMMLLAVSVSKFSFILISVVIVPFYYYIDIILKLWLSEVPQYSGAFIIVIATGALLDSLSTGLSLSNKAIGKLKRYSLTVDSLKLLTIPAFLLAHKIGLSITLAFWSYAIMEGLSSFVRVCIMYEMTGYHPLKWLKNVVFPLLLPFLYLCGSYYLINIWTDNFLYIILGGIIITFSYFILFVFTGTNDFEKTQLSKMIQKLRLKL